MGKIIKMAWRNVWRNGRRTLIAVIAIALGLTFLIFFDGVFAGSGQAIFGNAVKLQGGNIMIQQEQQEKLQDLYDNSNEGGGFGGGGIF